MEENKEKNWCEEISEKISKEIEKINNQGVNLDTITYLGKLIDSIKDIDNITYWKEKIKMYRDNYEDYNDGSYGRRRRDSRGRFMDYGRRGVPGSGRGRYRGHDMLDDMYQAYSDYMDSKEYGTYGTSEDMMRTEIMADSLKEFAHHIKKEAKTPEEKHIIEETLREVGRM